MIEIRRCGIEIGRRRQKPLVGMMWLVLGVSGSGGTREIASEIAILPLALSVCVEAGQGKKSRFFKARFCGFVFLAFFFT